jgi:hypothetical protein
MVLGSRKVLEKKLKCTLQKSLKLGFAGDTRDELNLREGRSVLLYYNSDPATENIVFMKFEENTESEDAYPIKRAGNYYNVNSQGFFKKLGKDLNIDFTKTKYIYDMEKTTIDGNEFWMLIGRLPKGKGEEEEAENIAT